MWSALFELGPALKIWKGWTLNELIHSSVLEVIFVLGSFILIFAILVK
jgi:hypothetical protein